MRKNTLQHLLRGEGASANLWPMPAGAHVNRYEYGQKYRPVSSNTRICLKELFYPADIFGLASYEDIPSCHPGQRATFASVCGTVF